MMNVFVSLVSGPRQSKDNDENHHNANTYSTTQFDTPDSFTMEDTSTNMVKTTTKFTTNRVLPLLLDKINAELD